MLVKKNEAKIYLAAEHEICIFMNSHGEGIAEEQGDSHSVHLPFLPCQNPLTNTHAREKAEAILTPACFCRAILGNGAGVGIINETAVVSPFSRTWQSVSKLSHGCLDVTLTLALDVTLGHTCTNVLWA